MSFLQCLNFKKSSPVTWETYVFDSRKQRFLSFLYLVLLRDNDLLLFIFEHLSEYFS